MLLVALPALLALAAPGPPSPSQISEEECDALAPGPGHESTRIGSPHVLEMTARDGPFVSDLPHDTLIVCARSSIVPTPNDWKVVAAGYRFFLTEAGDDSDRARVGSLDNLSGSYRYIMFYGDFRGEEGAQVQQRVDQFNHLPAVASGQRR